MNPVNLFSVSQTLKTNCQPRLYPLLNSSILFSTAVEELGGGSFES